MTRISLGDMNVDPRNDFQKLSRSECRTLLKKAEIAFKPDIKQRDAVKLLQAHSINPRDGIEWEQVIIKGPDGNDKIKYEPKRTLPQRPEGYDELALAKVDELSAKAIENEKKDKEKVKSLENEVSDLKELVARLLEERKEPTTETTVSVVVDTDYMKMHWKSFQKLAKEAGIEWTTREPREPVIEKLEAQNGKDAA